MPATDERTLSHLQFDGADHLQRQIDADWDELNAQCPSQAKGCGGQPPLVAHPDLLIRRRPYQPEFVFTQVRPQKNRRLSHLELAPIRLAAQGLSSEALTGLPLALTELPTRQLMLPLLMCGPAAIEQGARLFAMPQRV